MSAMSAMLDVGSERGRLGLPLVEVVEVEAFDEVLEGGHALELGGVDGLRCLLDPFDVVTVLVKQNAGLRENVLLGKDGDFRADGEGDGVAGARVDLHRATV